MSEILWAAVIGGAIAIAATIPPLIYSHYHWKKDKKLEHLRAELRHKEEQYLSILSKLADCIKSKGDWDWDMVTRLCLVLRDDKNIVPVLQKMVNTEIPRQEMREEYKQIELAMKESLAEIDKKINELMS